MKDFVNTQLNAIRKYVDDNNGFGRDMIDSKEYNDYIEAMQQIRNFDGQKVAIEFNAEMDFLRTNGSKKGKIKIVEDRIRFYEGRKTARFYYLDAGLYNGWFATLIPTKITTNKQP